MTQGQYDHITRILNEFNQELKTKYVKGAHEHGTVLYEYSAKELLDFAIEEAIDQVTYLFTLREALKGQE